MTPDAVRVALESFNSPRLKPVRSADENTVVFYGRVSTQEQANSGAGLAAQRAAVEEYAARKGLTIVAFHEDAGVSGSLPPAQRPGLSAALTDVYQGTAARLIVAKIDRLARRFKDSVNLMEMAIEQNWQLMIADIDADLTTSEGRFLARLYAALAEDERDKIRTRTREALAAKKAAGVRLGRPSTLPTEVVERIVRERDAGTGWQKIANGLMADGIPTARGGQTWHTSTVRKVYIGQDAEKIRQGKAA